VSLSQFGARGGFPFGSDLDGATSSPAIHAVGNGAAPQWDRSSILDGLSLVSG
jgi:hypothetical protein